MQAVNIILIVVTVLHVAEYIAIPLAMHHYQYEKALKKHEETMRKWKEQRS